MAENSGLSVSDVAALSNGGFGGFAEISVHGALIEPQGLQLGLQIAHLLALGAQLQSALRRGRGFGRRRRGNGNDAGGRAGGGCAAHGL